MSSRCHPYGPTDGSDDAQDCRPENGATLYIHVTEPDHGVDHTDCWLVATTVTHLFCALLEVRNVFAARNAQVYFDCSVTLVCSARCATVRSGMVLDLDVSDPAQLREKVVRSCSDDNTYA
jgi:hypothetical protein